MNILVYGLTGRLGRSIKKNLHKHPDVEIINGPTKFGGLNQEWEIEADLLTARPDVVLNLAASTDTNKDINKVDHQKMLDANVSGPIQLAKLCLKYEIPMIHISTDYVLREPMDQSFYTLTKKFCDDVLLQVFSGRTDLLKIVYTSFFDDEWLTSIVFASKKFRTPKQHVDKISDRILTLILNMDKFNSESEVFIGDWYLPTMRETVEKYKKIKSDDFTPVDGVLPTENSFPIFAKDEVRLKQLNPSLESY
jgi:dTDP-4-dehydrorhamnose reductase